MDRTVPFADVVAGIVPHFVSRAIYCGAGKVGCETRPSTGAPCTSS